MTPTSNRSYRARTPLAAGIALALALTLAACDTRADRTEIDTLRDRVQLAEARLDEVDRLLGTLRSEVDGTADTLAGEAQSELAEARTLLNDVLASAQPALTDEAPAPGMTPLAPAADPGLAPGGAPAGEPNVVPNEPLDGNPIAVPDDEPPPAAP